MDRKLKLFVLALIGIAILLLTSAQRGVQIIISPDPTAAASCAGALVISGTNFNTSAGATFTVAPTSGNWCASPGRMLTCVENDHSSSANAPSVPTDGGDTFVQDATVAHAQGRTTFFSFLNCSTSRATITMNPGASRNSDATCMEFSGAKTSSAFDNATATLSNSGSVDWNGYSLASASNLCSIGIEAALDNAAVAQYTAGTGWTIPAACSSTPFCGQTHDGDGSLYAYELNAQGQFGVNGTRPAGAVSIFSAAAFYKTATAGIASGFYPSVYIDFSGGTNTNTPTATTLASGTHGGPVWHLGVNSWTCVISCTGMTYTSTNEQSLHTQVTTQGVTYPVATPTLGIKWNPSVMAGNNEIGYKFDAVGNQASMCHYIYYDSSSNPTVSQTNVNGIFGGDRATVLIGYVSGSHDDAFLETAEGDSPHITNLDPNVLYYLCIGYDGRAYTSGACPGSTGCQTLTISSCGTPSSPSFPCSAATGSPVGEQGSGTPNNPDTLNFGHVSGGSSNINYFVYNVQADWINATNPLGP